MLLADELVDAITKPMILDNVEDLPSNQLLENLARREFLPTGFYTPTFLDALDDRIDALAGR